MYKPLRVMCAVNIESKICHPAPLICIAKRTEGETGRETSEPVNRLRFMLL